MKLIQLPSSEFINAPDHLASTYCMPGTVPAQGTYQQRIQEKPGLLGLTGYWGVKGRGNRQCMS